MVAVQSALHLDQLLEVILRWNKVDMLWYDERVNRICLTDWLPDFLSALTPCFMMSLAWLATSFTIARAAEWIKMRKRCTSHTWQTMFPLHRHHQVSLQHTDVKRPLVYLVCPCNRLSLQTGFLGSLKHNYKHLSVRINSPTKQVKTTLYTKCSVLCSKIPGT